MGVRTTKNATLDWPIAKTTTGLSQLHNASTLALKIDVQMFVAAKHINLYK